MKATDLFRGEYRNSLNSDDIADPELPLIKNRSNGGTMIMWKKNLDQFVTVIPPETASFLAILFQPPHTHPSIHVSLYLLTSGKESEFITEITKLRIFLEEMQDLYPNYLVFLRGDSNVNSNNKPRLRIFNNFMSSLNLTSISFEHKTYHHFLGDGLFDSKIDVLVHVNDEKANEDVADIFCREDYPIIHSHHDIISSVFHLPGNAIPAVPLSTQVPVTPNTRIKIIWSYQGIPTYQSLIGQSLADLRKRWLVPSSRSCVSILIQLSSNILSSAAAASNPSLPLSETPSSKSKNVPRAIRSAQNRVQRMCRNLRALKPTDPMRSHATEKLKEARNNLRKKIRAVAGAKTAADDQRMVSLFSAPNASSTLFKKIKSMRSSSAKPISFLRVGADVFHGEDVQNGFFTSISKLKTRDLSNSSRNDVSQYAMDYKYILDICQDKNDLPHISLNSSTRILREIKRSVNDIFSITPAH